MKNATNHFTFAWQVDRILRTISSYTPVHVFPSSCCHVDRSSKYLVTIINNHFQTQQHWKEMKWNEKKKVKERKKLQILSAACFSRVNVFLFSLLFIIIIFVVVVYLNNSWWILIWFPVFGEITFHLIGRRVVSTKQAGATGWWERT